MTKSYSCNQPTIRLNFIKTTLLTLIMLFLVGCVAQQMSQSQTSEYDPAKGSFYYLSQANQVSGSNKTNWQLLAIRAFIDENKLSNAQQLFTELPATLNLEQQKERSLLQGEFAVKSGQAFSFGTLAVNSLNDQQKMRYYQTKIQLDSRKKDSDALLRDYIELEKYGSDKQRHDVINQTWDFLTSFDQQTLNGILVYANEPTLQGWIDLLYTYRNNSDVFPIHEDDSKDIIEQKENAQFNLLKQVINEWQLQYSNHPAAIYLPRNIYGEKYRLPDDNNSKNIALFLPLSGASKIFGDTVELGYADAEKFYPQESQQNIYLFDTNSSPLDILLIQANQKNIDLIVGPLLKENVAEIKRLAPDIPVLALNKIDEDDQYSTASMCYFSLSPEDEAQDAAIHIHGQKKKLPLLIVPNNDLGKRVVNSFAEQWSLYDSNINAYVQYFDSIKSLSNNRNKGIGIELEGEKIILDNPAPIFNEGEQSDGLHSFLTNMLSTDAAENNPNFMGETEEKEPIFDAVYIYGSKDELMLIKSMLEMQSNKTELDSKGQKVPIKKVIPMLYSSSRSHQANPTQDFYYDMDKVQFSEIPLIANQTAQLDALPSYIKNDYSLVRLYAMGVDAWRLANRFSQLKPYTDTLFEGMTGSLAIGRNCEIDRTLTWKQYRNGQEIFVR